MPNKAFFINQDGIITQMCYESNHGNIHTPLNSSQVKLVFGIDQLLKHTKKLGYLNIIISNQPNIGLGKLGSKQFDLIGQTILSKLKKSGATIDNRFYCHHHPFAKLKKYRKKCECRKPNIDMFQKAVQKHNINLKQSWMIGDGVNDIIAGHRAGCKTILLGNKLESGYLKILQDQLKGIKPTHIIKKLPEAIPLIQK